VECGSDLRERTKVKAGRQSDAAADERDKAEDRNLAGISPAAWRRIVTSGILLSVLLGSALTAWLGWRAYKWYEFKRAYYRIGNVLDAEKPQPHSLARDAFYLVWFCDEVERVTPHVAERRKMTMASLIPGMPATVDLDPLLEFPPDSFAYGSVLALAGKHTDLDWQIAKSCDASPNARSYGADLLISRLPFLDFDEAGREALMEATSVAQKQGRFGALHDESLEKARDALVGSYRLELKLMSYEMPTGSGSRGRPPTPVVKELRFAAVDDALSVACDDDAWTVTFLGETWTGTMAQLPDLSIVQPIAAIGGPLSKAGIRWQQGRIHGEPEPEVHFRYGRRQLVVHVGPFGVQQLEQWAGSAAPARDRGYVNFQATLVRTGRAAPGPDEG